MDRLQDTWADITKVLVSSEKVHIIVYSETHEELVREFLENREIDMKQIDFHIYETDDVWVRDNGPIFVKNQKGELVIQVSGL